MEQPASIAIIKVYEAYKTGTITEEQLYRFVNLIEEGLIGKEIIQKYKSNTAHDAMVEIFRSCQDKAKEQGFGKAPLTTKLADGTIVGPADERYYEADEYIKSQAPYHLKSFAIYISKTTAVNKHKSIMLEDIISERIEFPVDALEHAKGKQLLEEKFILLDYLKTHMDNNSKYQEAFNILHNDIQFSSKNM